MESDRIRENLPKLNCTKCAMLLQNCHFSHLFYFAAGWTPDDTTCCYSRNLYLKIVFQQKNSFITELCECRAHTHTNTHSCTRLTVHFATLSIFKWPISFGHFVAASMDGFDNVIRLAFAYLYSIHCITINSCVERVRFSMNVNHIL